MAVMGDLYGALHRHREEDRRRRQQESVQRCTGGAQAGGVVVSSLTHPAAQKDGVCGGLAGGKGQEPR